MAIQQYAGPKLQFSRFMASIDVSEHWTALWNYRLMILLVVGLKQKYFSAVGGFKLKSIVARARDASGDVGAQECRQRGQHVNTPI